MILNYSEAGSEEAPAMVCLHGLLGSSRNWRGAARFLSEHYRVITPDARNHGESFHTSTHTFEDMVQDLQELIDQLGLDTVTLVGHSMGGKVAMAFACRYPERVDRLFVIDTAPKDYPPYHETEFAAMNALDLGSLENRSDADDFIAGYIDDWAFRQFLISNIVRGEDGRFKWTVNLSVIEAHLGLLAKNALDLMDVFEAPTHFLVGGLSKYVDENDHTDIRFHFPDVSIDTWEDSGHNPHFEHRDRFVKWVLEKVDS